MLTKIKPFAVYAIATVSLLSLGTLITAQLTVGHYSKMLGKPSVTPSPWLYVLPIIGSLLAIRLLADGLMVLYRRGWQKEDRKWLVIGIGLLYVINASYHVNDTHFKWWNPFYLELIQPQLLVILAIPLCWVMIFLYRNKRLSLKREWRFLYPDASPYTIGASLLTMHLLIAQYFYERTMGALIEQYPQWFILMRLIVGIVLAYSVIYLLLRVFVAGVRALSQNQSTWQASVVLSLAIALVFNFAFQAGMSGGGSYYGRYAFPGAFVFQVGLLTLLSLAVYMLINRQILATFIVVTIYTIIALVNSIKFSLRAEPFTPNDIKWAKDIKLLLGFISVRQILLLLSLLIILLVAYWYCRRHFLSGKITTRWSVRLGLIGLSAVVIFGLVFSLKSEKDNRIDDNIPVISSVTNWRNVNWKGYTFIARQRSLSYLWMQQFSKDVMEEPVHYSKKRIQAICQKYKDRADVINQDRTQELSEQTVIYVLSESLSNPNRVPGVTTSRELLPAISAIEGKTTGGTIQTTHYGGGTANVEYQAYTGLPFSNFTTSVSAAYLDVFPSMKKKGPFISQQFKPANRLAIHPYKSSSYNRKDVYEALGVSEFWTLDAGKYQLKPTKEDYLGNYVSDSYAYQETLSKIDPSKNQFISLITMQNHVEWECDDPQDVMATGADFTATANAKLTNYARLITHTDQATKDFLDRLSKIDHKITVVFYGDHLPGIYPEKAFATNPNSQYQTDYFIWSNYPTKKVDVKEPAISDVQALLLETTNSKVTPYQALLTDVLAGKQDAKDDLEMVQYDLTSRKGYMANSFFKLQDQKPSPQALPDSNLSYEPVQTNQSRSSAKKNGLDTMMI